MEKEKKHANFSFEDENEVKTNSPLSLSGIRHNLMEANQAFVDINRRGFLKKSILFTGGLLVGSKMMASDAMAVSLDAPRNLSFSHPLSSSSAVTFSWDAVTGAEGYKLYSKGVTGWALLQDVGNVTSKTYPIVPAGVYKVAVVAYAAGVVSSGSNVVDCYVSFPPPTFLSSSVSASGTLTLSWNAVTGAAGYALNLGTSPGVYAYRNVALGNVTTKRYGNVRPGTYYVTLTPYNSRGTSGSSSTELTIIVPNR